MRYPQGYHITWSTHGARLPGTSKTHVDREHNTYLGPFAPTNLTRENRALEEMSGDAVALTIPQRELVEQVIKDVASRYEWTVHAIAVQSDHVHVVITALREGDELREALKAVASRALNKSYDKQKWWAENGSDRYLWERDYFLNSVQYVEDQRDF